MNPNAYPPSSPAQRTSSLPGFWGVLLNTTSLYGEVLLRSKFGERHLTFARILVALIGLLFLPIVVVMAFTFFLGNFLMGSMGGLVAAIFSSRYLAQPTFYFNCYVLLFLAKSCWLFVEMEYRRQAGDQSVSSYSGKPSPLWNLVPGLGRNEDAIKRFGEPAFLLLLALWLRQTDLILCLYLGCSAVAMFTRGHFEHLMATQLLYDLHDQILESQALGGSLRGRSNQPGDLKGVATPAMLSGYLPHQADALASTIQAQSPLSPVPTGAMAMPMRGFSGGLPPEYASLLSQPAAPLQSPIVREWIVNNPAPERWFTRVPDAQSEANQATESFVWSPVYTNCPKCNVRLNAPEKRKAKHHVRCKGCRHEFVLDKSVRCFRVRRKLGTDHAA